MNPAHRCLWHDFVLILALVPLWGGTLIAGESNVRYLSGKDTVAAYLSVPDGDGPFPAVILVHEWWGLNDWIKSNAQRFVNQGYIALAIDLYRGHSTSSAEEAHELMRGLPEERAERDLKASAQFLRGMSIVDPQRIASIGWCMGGGYSLVAARRVPGLSASVICYGRLATGQEEIAQISCPLLGIFGEQDRGITIESVREFVEGVHEAGKDIKVVTYPDAGHAFMNPNNKLGYRPEDAAAAWKIIDDFLAKKLQ